MTLWIYYARVSKINRMTKFMMINDSARIRVIPAV